MHAPQSSRAIVLRNVWHARWTGCGPAEVWTKQLQVLTCTHTRTSLSQESEDRITIDEFRRAVLCFYEQRRNLALTMAAMRNLTLSVQVRAWRLGLRPCGTRRARAGRGASGPARRQEQRSNWCTAEEVAA